EREILPESKSTFRLTPTRVRRAVTTMSFNSKILAWKRTQLFWCWLTLLTAVSNLSAALVPSESKIGPHLHIRYTAGARQILQAGPRVIKILDTLSPLMQAVREYKAGTPGGIVVLRAYTTRGYVLSDDPAASASDFWTR